MVSLIKDLLLLSAAIVPSIVSAAGLREPSSIIPGAYIVEFADGFADGLTNDHLDIFFTDLSLNNIPATPRMNLSHSFFNGASFHLGSMHDEKRTLQQITSLDSVKKIYPMRRHSLSHEVHSTGIGMSPVQSRLQKRAKWDTFSTHAMTGVDKVRGDGYTGKGISVAIIDSGVDYTHPALGGCYGPGCKVSYGYDLVGDDFTGYNLPIPHPDPFDNCVGHGTHVAGIIAAEPNEYGFTGVAPNVTLGMFRALGCAGFTTDDVLIQAFTLAYDYGADLITASLGGSSGEYENPWVVVMSRIVEAGVPCTLAAGNDGEFGPFCTSGGADGKGVTAIASVDNDEIPMLLIPGSYTVGNIVNSYGWTPGLPSNISSGTYRLYALSHNITSTDDGCHFSEDIPDLSRYIVLIRLGGCGAWRKAAIAASYGAKHVLFYYDIPGTRTIDLGIDLVDSVGFVPEEQAKIWVALLSAGEYVYLDVEDPAHAAMKLDSHANSITGSYPSIFTSWGPTTDGRLKPQVAAPGGYILSTFPLNMGGYAILSGTSMSTPFAAGSIALMMQKFGKLSPATIESLLSSTANPTAFNDGKRTYPFLAPVAQQGGGLIDVYKAINSNTVLNVSGISFNDTENLRSVSFSITNQGDEAVAYRLGYVPSLTTYALPANDSSGTYDFSVGHPLDLVPETARLSFSTRTVTIEAGQSATIDVTATLPSDLTTSRIPVYGGYITLNATNGDSLSLPYLGVAASLRGLRVLDTRGRSVYLSSSTSNNLDPNVNGPYNAVKSGASFTLSYPSRLGKNGPSMRANTTFPTLVAELPIGSPLVRVDIQPVESRLSNATTTILGQRILGSIPGFPMQHVPRDTLIASWNGQLSDGSYAPAGKYRFLVSALKIFGDPKKKEDYEQVKTVIFGIKYV